MHYEQTINLFAEQLASLHKTMVQQAEVVKDDPVVKSDPRRAVKRSMQKLMATDDVESYLATFERFAEMKGLLEKDWADVLAAFLSAEPQQAYYDLSLAEAQIYKNVKAEILAELEVTMALCVDQVHSWWFDTAKPARAQLYRLMHLFQSWLQQEEMTPIQIVERVALDRFMHGMPKELSR